ncbi:hypothetical protein K2173_014812 [Erythroxylum novogranatense]|uniref:Transmembrane protein n=1 Tax=Erythroxylum novogranatense TaxID=1862640 RepID=A0AAV8TI28_9ROSI|nr:hypothetical protein K2173_014812 [Erythroxylum novogranatense]
MCSLKLWLPSNPTINPIFKFHLRLHSPSYSSYNLLSPTRRPFSPLVVQCRSTVAEDAAASEIPSAYSQYTASVGSPPASSYLVLRLTQRHILFLIVVACAMAVSATWLFLSAIPTLLAFKRAAESLEKLTDVTREELPGTMAAIRLSGMEISDLTVELSDIGQEITRGVKSSTKAVRVAEERLRQFTNMAPPASLQMVTDPRKEKTEPAVARTARGIREGIVKGRALFQMFLTLGRFSRMTIAFFAKRAKR